MRFEPGQDFGLAITQRSYRGSRGGEQSHPLRIEIGEPDMPGPGAQRGEPVAEGAIEVRQPRGTGEQPLLEGGGSVQMGVQTLGVQGGPAGDLR